MEAKMVTNPAFVHTIIASGGSKTGDPQSVTIQFRYGSGKEARLEILEATVLSGRETENADLAAEIQLVAESLLATVRLSSELPDIRGR